MCMSVCVFLFMCGIHVYVVCECVCVWAHLHRSTGPGTIEKSLLPFLYTFPWSEHKENTPLFTMLCGISCLMLCLVFSAWYLWGLLFVYKCCPQPCNCICLSVFEQKADEPAVVIRLVRCIKPFPIHSVH